MGLFGFRKRPAATNPPASSESSDDALGLGDRRKARCCHYAMAHYALRTFALSNPLQCLAILGSPKAREFLASLLEVVANNCAGRGETPDFGPADLTITPSRVAGYPVAVVGFPTPQAIAEAFFVAIVLLARLEDGKEQARTAKARYFTLEKGFSLKTASDRTALCEWTDTSHINFGDGPTATVQDFLKAIEGHLTRMA